ncbi:MAG TPA: DUF5671 domain-containing protein [Patescibacteria group bacterium]|jgi:hypothetical protein|nr:DUF5671 domain-containing protein [Patescibacteria group bacterium]
MNQDLIDYIKQARAHNNDNETIKGSLITAGWEEKIVDSALKANLDLIVPPPPPHQPLQHTSENAKPIAVVQNMSTRGIEYVIMFIALGASAISLGFLLHNMVDRSILNVNNFDDSFISVSSAALLVSLPIFALLFLRLKRAELKDAALYHDPSRRKAIQLTLIITFLIGLYVVISYVYSLLNSINGTNAVANLIHSFITLVISGGIFTYYWRDIHHKGQ